MAALEDSVHSFLLGQSKALLANMPFVRPDDWDHVTERLRDEAETATETAYRHAPFAVVRVALTVVLVAVFVSVFPAAAQSDPSVSYFAVSGRITTQLAAVPDLWMDATGTPLDDVSGEWAAIAVLLLTTAIVALFAMASFTLLTSAIRQLAMCLILSIMATVLVYVALSGGGADLVIPAGQGCVLTSFTTAGILQLSILTSHAVLEALGSHPKQSQQGRQVCQAPIIRVLGVIGQAVSIGALLSYAFIPSFASRSAVGKQWMTIFLSAALSPVWLTSLIACGQEVRGFSSAGTRDAANHQTALRIANVTALVSTLATPMVFFILAVTAASDNSNCPDFLINTDLVLPSTERWPFGCLTINCFSNIRGTISSRTGMLWAAALTYVALALVVILAAQADVASVRENDARNAASNMRQALQYISHEARAPLGGAILSLTLLDAAVTQADFPSANLLISDLNLSLEAAQRQLTDLLAFDSDLGDAKAASVARWTTLEGKHLARLQSSFAGACQAEAIQLEMATTSSFRKFPPMFNVRDYWTGGQPLIRLLEEAQSNSTSRASPSGGQGSTTTTTTTTATAARTPSTSSSPALDPPVSRIPVSSSSSNNGQDWTAVDAVASPQPLEQSKSAAEPASGSEIASAVSRRRQSHLQADIVTAARPPTHSASAVPSSGPRLLVSPTTATATARKPTGGGVTVSAAEAIGLLPSINTASEQAAAPLSGIAAARGSSTSSGSVSQPAHSKVKPTTASLAAQSGRLRSLSPAPVLPSTAAGSHTETSATAGEPVVDTSSSFVVGLTQMSDSPSLGHGMQTTTEGTATMSVVGTEGRMTASLAPDTEIYADIDRILAIVTNALSNSIKHVVDDGTGKIAVLLSLLPHSVLPGSTPAREPPAEPMYGYGRGSAGQRGNRGSVSTMRRRRPMRVNLGGVRSFFTRGTDAASGMSESRILSGDASAGGAGGDTPQTRALRSRGSAESVDAQAHSKPAIRVLEIQVLDNGRGIPQSALKPGRLFHPFQQLRHDDASRRMTSTGLGLSIVKSVVLEQLHGEIGLASREGEGTLFFARIPVYARSTVPTGQPSGLPSQAPIDAAGAESAGWTGEQSLRSIGQAGGSRVPSRESDASSREPGSRRISADYRANSRIMESGGGGGESGDPSVTVVTSGRRRATSSADMQSDDGQEPRVSVPLHRPNSFQHTQQSPKLPGTSRALQPAPQTGDETAVDTRQSSIDVRPPDKGKDGSISLAENYRPSLASRAARESPVQPKQGATDAKTLAGPRESEEGAAVMVIGGRMPEGKRTAAVVAVSGMAGDSKDVGLSVDVSVGVGTTLPVSPAGGTQDPMIPVRDATRARPTTMASSAGDGITDAIVVTAKSRSRPSKSDRDARKSSRDARRAQRQAERQANAATAAAGGGGGGGGGGGKQADARRDRVELGLAYVVDDERVNRTLMAKLLRGWGFDSVEMVDGTELVAAIEALVEANDTDKAHWPAVITLDIQMPEMDGFMTLTALAKLSRELTAEGKPALSSLISGLVVLGVTGNAVEADKARMSRLGARRVLIKPVVPTYLAESVEEFCPLKLPRRAHKRVGASK